MEICSHMSTKGSKNIIFDFFKSCAAPDLPNCPFKDNMFQINNLTYPQSYATYWPEGEYRGFISLSDDQDEKIYDITFVQSIRNTQDMQEFK